MPSRYLGCMVERAVETWDLPAASPDDRLAGMSDAELHDHSLECHRREHSVAAEAAEALAEIDRRRFFLQERYLSPITFVAHRAGDSPSGSRRPPSTGAGPRSHALHCRSLPKRRHRHAAGPPSDARSRCCPEAFGGDEAELVDRARREDATSFTLTIERWRSTAAPEVTHREEQEHFERRHPTLSDTFDGMTHLEADLDPLSGETAIAAINARRPRQP